MRQCWRWNKKGSLFIISYPPSGLISPSFLLFSVSLFFIPLQSFHSFSLSSLTLLFYSLTHAHGYASHHFLSPIHSFLLPFLLLSLSLRLAWELEEIKHNFLDKYFESAARERELHFTDFISWESIQAELWYNKRGLSENIIADIWEGIAGCVSRGVDKDTFMRIYKVVCGATYLA